MLQLLAEVNLIWNLVESNMLQRKIIKNINTQKEYVALLLFNKYIATLYCVQDNKEYNLKLFKITLNQKITINIRKYIVFIL